MGRMASEGLYHFYVLLLWIAASAKRHTMSEENENAESSETSPDMSPMHVSPYDIAAMHEDASKRLVEPGRPTRISVCKGKCGLGLKVIGGLDTILVSV